MKTLPLSLIVIIVIVSLFTVSTYLIVTPPLKPTCLGGSGMCDHEPIPQQTGQDNNTSFKITTVIIPKNSEDPSSGKNYEPDHLVVVLGINNTVRWVSQSESANTISPDMPLIQNGKSFGSGGVIKPGGSYEFTFTEPGTFAYHTEPHPWMKGTVTVLPCCYNMPPG